MNPKEADNVTSGRLLDPDEARRRLESRLGPLHARLRLGIEREHEAQAFGQGLNFLHLENLPLMQAMIEIGLRVTGGIRCEAPVGKPSVSPAFAVWLCRAIFAPTCATSIP